ncbi:lysozyme [Parasphingorhabdus sp. JC815]|uniref:lysozyme n=1 Tax=Parasphingorhabdus sp. JC815 TaxID=3232140 RepID=UPI0034583B34
MKIEPMQPDKKPVSKKQMGAGAAIVAMLAIATPFVASWEGKSNDPYKDIVGVLTVCYGETRNIQHRRYSDAECSAMLQDGLGDFGEAVAKRNPELRGHPNQWAAATSLAYNIGKSAYNRSTVAKRFEQGRWRSACDNFLSWKYAGGRVVKGLVNRRHAERKICLTNLPKERNLK